MKEKIKKILMIFICVFMFVLSAFPANFSNNSNVKFVSYAGGFIGEPTVHDIVAAPEIKKEHNESGQIVITWEQLEDKDHISGYNIYKNGKTEEDIVLTVDTNVNCYIVTEPGEYGFQAIGFSTAHDLEFNCYYEDSEIVCMKISLVDLGLKGFSVGSDVIDDLELFNDFETSNYQGTTDIYDVQLLNIAETEFKELLIYVNTPSSTTYKNSNIVHTGGNLTSINISTGIGDDLEFKNYKLEPAYLDEFDNNDSFSSENGVFEKYLVKDFVVSDDSVRYYEISAIYSNILPNGLGVETENIYSSQSIDEYAYKVASRFKFEDQKSGGVKIDKIGTDVVTIIDSFVGFVRYKNDSRPNWINKDACDRHFIAFNADKQIDKLLEAEVYYISQSVERTQIKTLFESAKFGEKKEHYVDLSYTDAVDVENGNLLFWKGFNYSWDRIESVSDFIQEVESEKVYSKGIFDNKVDNEIDSSAKQALQNMQWVLSFAETDYDYTYVQSEMPSDMETKTLVGEVTILRLRFETEGVTYNLAAIDNKHTGSDDPINETEISTSLNKEKVNDILSKTKTLFGLILLVVLIIILWPILMPIITLVIKVLGFILNLIIKIITFPFRLFSHKKKRVGRK